MESLVDNSKTKPKQPTIKDSVTISDIIQPKKQNRKYLSKEEATARLPVGRPKGAKNNTTIFKEVIREGFEKQLLKDGMKVVEAVIKKALDGDMTAAKLLLDRILPTTKAIDLEDLENAKGFAISINIGQLDAPKHLLMDRVDKNVIDVTKGKDE